MTHIIFRSFVIAAVVLFLASCWMFEKTDERPAPFVDAADAAVVAFDETTKSVPQVPGSPTWLIALLAGGAAAFGAFANRLVTRKRELNAAEAIAEEAVKAEESKPLPAPDPSIPPVEARQP